MVSGFLALFSFLMAIILICLGVTRAAALVGDEVLYFMLYIVLY